jgi:hypothetical protein
MNPNQWIFLTADRMGWYRWTRKRRLKFKKRWRSQGHGSFRFFKSEFRCAVTCNDGAVILHVRE